jgi:hypothetical protein
VLCLAPRGPDGERQRADHQQDAYQRRARRVIGFPKVDARGGNADANGDESESDECVCDRGFHKVSEILLLYRLPHQFHHLHNRSDRGDWLFDFDIVTALCK